MYYLTKQRPGVPIPVDPLPDLVQPPDRECHLPGRDFTAVYAW